MNDPSATKHIHISESELKPSRTKDKPVKIAKPSIPKKRLITTHKKWDFDKSSHSTEYQLFLLSESHDITKGDPTHIFPKNENHIHLLKRQIHTKWYGYRAQDIEKSVFSPEEFISETDIVELLIHSRLLCFYCRENVQLLYENVRDPKQWSIERIDNKFGHNKQNVTIACLGCNVRRKTMYHERFRATKQMSIVKSD
jgi:hypothetical protein